MTNIITVHQLSKLYASGHKALETIDLNIQKGEILALLGPNGAGKTTLISIISGLVNKTSGHVTINGLDTVTHYKQARQQIGLVPQELHLGMFETVWHTLRYSRGLFGKSANDAYLDQLLLDLSLADKKHTQIRFLSGGMKRRVLIAKALAHQPQVLFLDEPTAGVDVELRKDMWQLVEKLRLSGVTIILTTHYIEEAEAIADRVAIINQGKIILIDDTSTIIKKLGKASIDIELAESISSLPAALCAHGVVMSENGSCLQYHIQTQADYARVPKVLQAISACDLTVRELRTSKSSLEDIFVTLVQDNL